MLNREDLVIRQHILNLMCGFETSWASPELAFPEIEQVLQQLQEMQEDELLRIQDQHIQILEKGKPFVRNICMAFDLRLKRRMPNNRIFSMTI